MTRTTRLRAPQVVRLTLACVLLFLVGGASAPLDAAPASTLLPEVGPALCPPQGVLIIGSFLFSCAVCTAEHRAMGLHSAVNSFFTPSTLKARASRHFSCGSLPHGE